MKKFFAIAFIAATLVASNGSGDKKETTDSTATTVVDSTVKAAVDSTVAVADSTVKAVVDSVKK